MGEARFKRIDRGVACFTHLEMEMGEPDTRLARVGDQLALGDTDRSLEVDVPGISVSRRLLAARHEPLETEPGVLVSLEMTVNRHSSAGMTEVQGAPVTSPFNLHTKDLAGRRRQDPIARPATRGDVD